MKPVVFYPLSRPQRGTFHRWRRLRRTVTSNNRLVCAGERSAVLMWLSSAKDYVQGLPFVITLTIEPSWIAM
ncbi:hypothetical protein ACXM2N_09210 [Corynebacterium sp. ZY180755]